MDRKNGKNENRKAKTLKKIKTLTQIDGENWDLPINNMKEIKKKKIFDKQVQQFLTKQKQARLKNLFQKTFPQVMSKQLNDESIVHEKWQEKQQSSQNFFSVIQQHQLLNVAINAIILILRVMMIWYTSMKITFDIYPMDYLYSIVGVFTIAKIIIFYFKCFKRNKSKDKKIVNASNIYIAFFCIYSQFSVNQGLIGSLILSTIYIALQCEKCSKPYRTIRRILVSAFRISRLIKLIEMLLTIVVVGHFFSIFLYLLTYIDENNNWKNDIEVNLSTWLDQYVYSLYFSFTTMFTVGYGDITPNNKCQIMGILFTQIFGVITIAFIISEIGATVSDIRKESEVIEQQISTIQRISKYYGLSPNLTYRARSFILNSQNETIKEKLGDQEALMKKFNDPIRQAIKNETNSKLINKSLFFLCYWTKDFRNQLAQYMIKTIIPQNQKIIQVPGQEKIYIIQKGKLKLNIHRKTQNKINLIKHVKTIDVNPDKEILDNTFGYLHVLTQKPINLSVIASSTVVAYTIDSDRFIKTVQQNVENYQYFMELKTKVCQKKQVQTFEFPSIANPFQHYYPNLYILLKKNRKSLNQQSRKRYQREQNKIKMIIRLPDVHNMRVDNNNIISISGRHRENTKKIKDFSSQFETNRNFTNFYPRFNLKQVISDLASKNFVLNIEGIYRR